MTIIITGMLVGLALALGLFTFIGVSLILFYIGAAIAGRM